MSKKEPMSIALKGKLLIQGEYLLIGLVFIVVGILKLTGVFPTNNAIRFHIFICITIVGSVWLFTDLIWSLISKKRRAKVDLLDKFLMIPLGISIMIFDIYSFIHWADGVPYFASYTIGANFSYIGAVYVFFAIYHWFFPSKALLRAIAEDEQAALEKKQAEEEAKKQAENKDESNAQ